MNISQTNIGFNGYMVSLVLILGIWILSNGLLLNICVTSTSALFSAYFLRDRFQKTELLE